MRASASSVTAIVLLLAAGCGGSGSARPAQSNAQREVGTTVTGWLKALTAGDNARACAYLTPGLQRSIDTQLRIRGETTTCRTFAAKWTGGTKPPGRAGAHVTSVVVTGAKADVTLKAPPDLESDVLLQKLGGRWLIQNY